MQEEDYTIWGASPILGEDEDYDPSNAKRVYGGAPKMERPKVLVIDGKPSYLYGPSGWAIHGGDRTACCVPRIDLPDGAGPMPAGD